MKISLLVLASVAMAQDFFPFTLPLGDNPSSAAHWGFLNTPIPADQPPPRIEGGRYVAGGGPLRLVGVNLGWLPRREEAAELAAALARFGVNAVRLHHIDAFWHAGVFGDTNTRRPRVALDRDFLTRLDALAEAFRERGIYLNVNLLTGRLFTSWDGLPREVNDLKDFKVRHALGFWYEPVLELQKRYARDLLGRLNSLTGRPWHRQANLLAVEINNEAGLIHSWNSAHLDALPPVFARPLIERWNRWLRDNLGETGWREAFRLRTPSSSGFAHSRWKLETHGRSQAQWGETGEGLWVEVQVPGQESWHVQLARGPLWIESRAVYRLRFEARADPPRRVWVALAYARPPWTDLGWSTTVEIGPEWASQEFEVVPTESEEGARLLISALASAAGRLEIRRLVLEEGRGREEAPGSPRLGTVPLPTRALYDAWPLPARRAWSRFLRVTEEAYWREMVRFLKQDLGLTCAVIGTTTFTSSPHLARLWDADDTHAYWQHPVFPGEPWDWSNWYVENRPALTDSGLTGFLGALALWRSRGRPYTVSEYAHPRPNLFAAEAFPLVALMASLQDWDGYYGFTLERPHPQGKLRGFFDLTNDPAVWATFGFAAMLFRSNQVGPLSSVHSPPWEESDEELLDGFRAWGGPAVEAKTGWPYPTLTRARWQLATEHAERPLRPPQGRWTWDPEGGRFEAVGQDVAYAVGYLAGRGGELGPLRWVAEPNQSGWGQILLARTRPNRWVVAAYGVARHRGQTRIAALGERLQVPGYAEAPPLEVERLTLLARLQSPGPARVWALDGRGERWREVPARQRDGWVEWSTRGLDTLWFEVEFGGPRP